MFNIEANIGDLEVIKDSTVHVQADRNLIVKIDNLEMEFKFLDNDESKDFAIEREIVGSRWIWKLTNFNNSLGQGLLEPFNIGTLRGKKLYSTFWVVTPDKVKNLRIINYVLFVKNEDNG